ncbi:MAG: hypothetical protein AB7I48_23725 [Planctomycetaceae bacterium]
MNLFNSGLVAAPPGGLLLQAAAGESSGLGRRLLFVAACVAVPVIWGVAVNWLFDLWLRRPVETDEDRIFPEYQI